MALAEGTLKRMYFLSCFNTVTCYVWSFFNFSFFIPDLINFLYLLYPLYFAEGRIGLLVSHLKQQTDELMKVFAYKYFLSGRIIFVTSPSSEILWWNLSVQAQLALH